MAMVRNSAARRRALVNPSQAKVRMRGPGTKERGREKTSVRGPTSLVPETVKGESEELTDPRPAGTLKKLNSLLGGESGDDWKVGKDGERKISGRAMDERGEKGRDSPDQRPNRRTVNRASSPK